MTAIVAETEKRELGGCPGQFSEVDLKFHNLLGGFPHRKLLTLTYTAKGNNFLAKAEGSLDLKGAHYSDANPKTSSKLKLITNVEGRDVEVKFNNKGLIRLWANLGTYNLKTPLTLTGKLKTDSKFKRLSYSAALNWSYKQFDIGTRVHIRSDGHPYLNESVEYTKDNLKVGGVYKLSLATFLFSKVHLYGAYKQNDYRLYFQHDVKGQGGFFSIGKTTLAATYKVKQYEYVVKAAHRASKPQDRLRVVAGVVAKLQDKSVLRAKINNQTSLAVSWKKAFSPNFTFAVGSKVQLNDSSSFTTSKVVPLPIGFSLKYSEN